MFPIIEVNTGKLINKNSCTARTDPIQHYFNLKNWTYMILVELQTKNLRMEQNYDQIKSITKFNNSGSKFNHYVANKIKISLFLEKHCFNFN